MKIKSLTISGTYAFQNETTIDFTDDQIVAVAGDNGAGKTTLLDAIVIALYGKVPNRKSATGNDSGVIYESFPSRKGLVDLTFNANSHEIRIKRLIDGPKRKQVPYLYVDGRAVTEGKAKEFDEELAKVFPTSEALFLASVYATQNGRGSVVSLDEKSRRGLLDEVLDLYQFEEPFEIVAEAAKDLNSELSSQNVLIDDIESRLEDLDAIDSQIVNAQSAKIQSEQNRDVLKEQIAELTQRIADVKAASADVRELQAQLDDARQRAAELESVKNDKQARIEKNRRELVDRKAEILDAVEKRGLADSKLISIETDLSQIESDIEKMRHYESEVLKSEKEHSNERIRHESDLTIAQSKLRDAENAASLLGDVPCTGSPMNDLCQLLAGARESAASLGMLKTEIEILTESIEHETNQLAQIDAELEDIRMQMSDLEFKRKTLRSEIDQLKRELSELDSLASLQVHLDTAEERIAQYESEIQTLDRDILAHKKRATELSQRLRDSEAGSALSDLQNELNTAQARLAETEREINNAQVEIAQLTSKLEQNAVQQRRLDELKSKLKDRRDRLARLNLLREGLGPKGARALRIDASGPAISETINSLLRECYGSRFQVVIKTQRETGKGDLKESLSISVIDNDNESETMIENKSGGEQAIIREAISLGLALYKRNHSNADLRTLIRDETTAALTDANAHLYLKMLRAALRLGEFDQILFVSHKSFLSELSDSVLFVAGGCVTHRAA